jgi:hypothetical protein
MSSSYRKIDYPCECGYNYGDCEYTNTFAYWDLHTNNTFHLYVKEHGKWRKLIGMEYSGFKALKELLTKDENDLSILSKEDYEALEKARYE